MKNILLSFDSLVPVIFVFYIKEGKNVFCSKIKNLVMNFLLDHNFDLTLYYEHRIYILAVVYLIIMLALSKLILYGINYFLSSENFAKGSIQEVDIATDTFLPSYLGYFFVALSIPNESVFWILFMFLFVFVKRSKQAHFNPIFVLLGYKYYNIEKDGVKSLIITKQELRDPKDIESDRLKRINDYTYIEY